MKQRRVSRVVIGFGNIIVCYDGWGRSPAARFPAFPRFKFGNGHVGPARRPADASFAIAGTIGIFSTVWVVANAPALLCKGDSGTPHRFSDSSRNSLRFAKLGSRARPRIHDAGHYAVNAAEFECWSGRLPGAPTHPTVVYLTFSMQASP